MSDNQPISLFKLKPVYCLLVLVVWIFVLHLCCLFFYISHWYMVNCVYFLCCKITLATFAEDKGPSFGLQGGYAINH